MSDNKWCRVRQISTNADMHVVMGDVEPGIAQTKPMPIPRRTGSSKELERHLSNSFGGHGNMDALLPGRTVVGSAGIPSGHHGRSTSQMPRPHRALINPFAPSRLHLKITSNRRRWAHAFPSDSQGAKVQLHHQNSSYGHSSYGEMCTDEHISPPTKEVLQTVQLPSDIRRPRPHRVSESSTSDIVESIGRVKSVAISSQDSGSNESLLEPRPRTWQVPGSGQCPPNDSAASFSSANTACERDGTYSSSVGRPRISWGLYNSFSSYHQDLTRALGPSGCAGMEGDLHNWLWGITGEQAWTPEVKTGMDWKALTKPASLPNTTDYYPDKNTLLNYYREGTYTLLPEDIATDMSQRWGSTDPKPLNTPQVYQEMINLRLSQGFQIVVQPKTLSSSSSGSALPAAMASSPYASRARTPQKPDVPTEEICLSIGRIFHKITLQGQSIVVNRYWPRYPPGVRKYPYNYRFQVPDSEHYDVSWTTFCSEALEHYKWNHADHYMCTQGKEGFELIEPLKYWRARFFLLPSNNPATKKILEGAARCDIYEPMSVAEQQKLVDGFVRLLEHMNKIRRPVQNQNRLEKHLGRRGSLTHSPGAFVLGLDKDKSSKPTTPIARVSDGMELAPTGSMGSVTEHKKNPSGDSSSGVGSLATSSSKVTQEVMLDRGGKEALSTSSPLTDVVEAMLDPSEGLSYLNPANSNFQPQSMANMLPVNSFISTEGAAWVLDSVTGIETQTQACQLLQKMVDQGLISHASGDRRKPYIYGFYLYFIVQSERERRGDGTLQHHEQPWQPGYYHNIYFQDDWCEVALSVDSAGESETPPFLEPELATPSAQRRKPEMKFVNVDIHSSQKSGRQEWGRACYHATASPTSAFELEVQWLVATGCIMGELIWSWYRKSTQCGFHFLPVPGDPFALPFTPNSDPLRGPIFIGLDLDCLWELHQGPLFSDFSKKTHHDRLYLFQDAILRRYGFMPDSWQAPEHKLTGHPSSYVHCSGGMFVLIHDYQAPLSCVCDASTAPTGASTHHEYIARQHGGPQSPMKSTGGFGQVGFLWAWNFMLTKRWCSSHTGDESFQDKMLADFRAFCSNKDGRLVQYWKSCWDRYPEVEEMDVDSKQMEEIIQVDVL